MISIDIPNNKINVAVDDATLEARRAKWRPREPRITTGYLRRYLCTGNKCQYWSCITAK